MRKRQHNPNKLIKLGLFTSEQAQNICHISQPTLSRWVKDGIIQRISRGVYFHTQSNVIPESIDFIVACMRFAPNSAIGGLTALFHYGLIDQAPAQTWVIVPTERVNRDRMFRCLRTTTSFSHGIQQNQHYKITTLERTILEALKFASKIGERVAIKAARKALNEGLTTESKLGVMAKKLTLQNVLKKYWEAIVV